MTLEAELEPIEAFTNFLSEYWIPTTNFEKPKFIISNDPDDTSIRNDLNDGDIVTILPGSDDQFTMRGNWVYYDRLFSIQVIVQTMISRQRMMDIGKMLRAICFVHKYDLDNWQRVKYLGRREYVNTDVNIWRSDMNFQLENYAVLSETALV
jgi:hypothetical protein